MSAAQVNVLDLLDQLYAARVSGRSAGLAGQVSGENPFSCHACRAQWHAGWAQGSTLRCRARITVVLQ